MKLYVLYTSYPYEGGYIHGVFTTRDKAIQALEDEGFDYGHGNTYINEVDSDEFVFQEIEV